MLQRAFCTICKSSCLCPRRRDLILGVTFASGTLWIYFSNKNNWHFIRLVTCSSFSVSFCCRCSFSVSLKNWHTYLKWSSAPRHWCECDVKHNRQASLFRLRNLWFLSASAESLREHEKGRIEGGNLTSINHIMIRANQRERHVKCF